VTLRIIHPWIDDQQDPLIVVTMEDCSEAETQVFYGACERIYKTLDHDIVWVLDTTHVTHVSAKQRRIAAEHVARARDKMRERVVAIAFVIPSPLIRGALTAIAWLVSLPFHYETFKTREEAISWAERRLLARQQTAGYAPPQA
jgi:hypothetical protein